MNCIAVVDGHWGIGRDNTLLFSIPGDMARFRELTTGGVVIMGRKTLESLPRSEPLKNRINVVFTRDESMQVPGAVICRSLPDLAETLKMHEPHNVFVIGGEAIYRLLLDYCEFAYITKVDANGHADRFFPDLDKEIAWVVDEQSEPASHNGLHYHFLRYHNRCPKSIPE